MKKEVFYPGCLCPVCETGTLSLVRRDLDFEYKGDKIVLTRDIWECSECHESFLQTQDESDIDRLLADRRRRVDGLLVSEDIIHIREQLHLTRADLAQTLRIPEQALTSYETGEDTQSYALDNVLRLLRVYPDAVNVLRQEWQDSGTTSAKPESSSGFTEELTPEPAGV